MPVTTPVELTFATALSPLDQTPPGGVAVKVIVEPTHNDVPPEITTAGLTVTVW